LPKPKGTIEEMIFADFVQNEFIRESSRLAGHLSGKVSSHTGFANRGTATAGFYVLKDVVSPSVLLEIGFISNVDEEKKLTDVKIQEKIAKAVIEGLLAFIEELEAGGGF
jgi:N-acetylmuramoyl-L-alanine amidase